MAETMRLVLIDDHPLFREGVAYTLSAQPDIAIVGQGANFDEALRLVAELSPDGVLLDVGIPGGGIQAAAAIAAAAPATRILMLTASAEEDDLAAAMQAGAHGYVLKGVAARELVGVVRAVLAGEGYVAPALAASLLSGLSAGRAVPQPAAGPLDDLTERERQVLDYVAGGLSNKEVGERLHLSEKTVKHYMTIIMEKLGARNRVEAALMARKGATPDR